MIKTINLSDIALDWAVSKAMGWVEDSDVEWFLKEKPYCVSNDKIKGKCLIDSEGVSFFTQDSWQDMHGNFYSIPSAKHPLSNMLFQADTKLCAAMKSIVHAHLGDEVDIPVLILQESAKDKMVKRNRV